MINNIQTDVAKISLMLISYIPTFLKVLTVYFLIFRKILLQPTENHVFIGVVLPAADEIRWKEHILE